MGNLININKDLFKKFLHNNPELKIHEWNIIPVNLFKNKKFNINPLIFSEQLLDYCKSNVCGNYGKSWTCPPHCGTIQEQKEKIFLYKNALVFTTKYDIEDSFDYEGMDIGRARHISVTLVVRDKYLKDKKTLVFGAGSCTVCKTTKDGLCMFPEPCRYPEKRIGSIEAAGINVTELSKTAGVTYNNGQNTVTFFSIILMDKSG